MSDTEKRHWRRHLEEADAVINGKPTDYKFTASACGRLILVEDTTLEATEADCPECALLAEFANARTRLTSRDAGYIVTRMLNTGVNVGQLLDELANYAFGGL